MITKNEIIIILCSYALSTISSILSVYLPSIISLCSDFLGVLSGGHTSLGLLSISSPYNSYSYFSSGGTSLTTNLTYFLFISSCSYNIYFIRFSSDFGLSGMGLINGLVYASAYKAILNYYVLL